MDWTIKLNLKTLLTYLGIVLLTAEFAPFIVGSIFLQGGYSRSEILDELKDLRDTDTIKTANTAADNYLSEHILHPYLGYVHQPDEYYNNYGYPMQDPLLKRSGEVLNVCLTGGSVAKQLFQESGEEIRNQLQNIEKFKNKKINLVSVALGGYKQPQQLLALNYLMSLGSEFDYIINLDGFNEVVLPFADNLPFRIHPAFPRHWNVYSRKGLDKEMALFLGRQTVLSQDSQERKRRLSTSLFRYSNLVLFIWKIREQEQYIKIQKIESEMRIHASQEEIDIQRNGPEYNFTDTLAFFKDQAEYWARCSRLMNALANESSVKYLHFLQPNQYLDGSKTLTSEELEIAFVDGDFEYKTAVHRAYPLLIQEGLYLKEDGVQFFDLTQLFKNEQETVYSDKCCHFNKKGYDAIATAVVQAISSNLN